MNMQEVVKNVKVAVSGSNLSLTAPIWLLAVVMIYVGAQAEQRIAKLEYNAYWTELVLRTKFPATTGAVDRVIRDRMLRDGKTDDDTTEIPIP